MKLTKKLKLNLANIQNQQVYKLTKKLKLNLANIQNQQV
jgi:hypothetical protein